MAEPTKTTVKTLTQAELQAEILGQLFRGLECSLTPGEIRRELSAHGVSCGAEELIHRLASMHRAGFVDMTGTYGSTLDELEVRFRLTPMGENAAAKDIRTHYEGDGCDPPHTIPDDVMSMVPPRDRSR